MSVFVSAPAFDRRGELTAVLRAGVRAVYQPIVELETGRTIAYEALARGPEGSPLESPWLCSTPPTPRDASPSSTGPAA